MARFQSVDEPPPPGWSPTMESLDDDGDYGIDAHAEFIRAVRSFHRTLLQQFQPTSTTRSALNNGAEPYMARFAQPYPARPIWACDVVAPSCGSDDSPLAAETGSTRDYSCAPLVCVVLKDSASLRGTVRNALCRLAAHPAGLLVTVYLLDDAQSDEGQQLLFVTVGLRPPQGPGQTTAMDSSRDRFDSNAGATTPTSFASPSRAVGGFSEDHLCSKAEQRQMVWAAVHEVLKYKGGEWPEFVADVYMLQDVWLYNRLFHWIRNQRGGPFMPISQDELDLLVHEYGEETATHFLYVRTYTVHLRWAALFSLICMAVTCLGKMGYLEDPDTAEFWKRAFLALFLPSWAVYFQASWKAAAQQMGFRWLGSLGAVQNSVKEVARLQALESKGSKAWRYLRVACLCVPLMLFQMLIVFSVSVTFVSVEVWIYDVAWETLSYIGRALAFAVYNVSFGVAFMLILGLFYPISVAVTRWEGHPEQDLSRWHLTSKIYGNWFFAIFFYFFVLAFCYIPFGDNIADVFATLFYPKGESGSEGGSHHEAARVLAEAAVHAVAPQSGLSADSGHAHHKEHRYSLRGTLEAFNPDVGRLAVEIMFFFVLQDICRLMQVLVPVVRAACGLEKLLGAQQGIRHRHKRTAIFFNAWCVRRLCCGRREVKRQISRDVDESEALGQEVTLELVGHSHSESEDCLEKSLQPRRPSVLNLVPTWRPEGIRAPSKKKTVKTKGQVLIAYCYFQHVEVLATASSPVADADNEVEVVVLACGLCPQGDSSGIRENEECPVVMSRLRTCTQSDRKPGILEEDPDDHLGDLITITVDPQVVSCASPRPGLGASATGSVQLTVGAEILGSAADANPIISQLYVDTSSTWGKIIEVPVPTPTQEEQPIRGTAKIGPVSVEYCVGIVSGPSRHEALERVPRHLRRSREGMRPVTDNIPSDKLLDEERKSLVQSGGQLPWMWWDEELTALYRDEVFELYAVKETFETFEIYAHLATSLSYVCLFGIAAPACPLLALLFVSVEARQDQLRLLWLSRPPHPDEETLRFKRTISIGAWYEIMRFTCLLSVIVNMLLWGLTYSGLNDPIHWSSTEWWRNIAVFLILQQMAFFIAGVLHRNVSQLDQETASAYLRRYARLQKALRKERREPQRSKREEKQVASRRKLTKQGSKGLSSLV